jgi:hypothetical protein
LERFTEDEVLRVIHFLPPDKAPGPDGFTTHFLRVVWATIRLELMQAFDALWHMEARKFHAITEAIMVLLPKTSEAAVIKDYCSISLIHMLGKLFSKVLASHLAPRLGELIHITQSAFV